jgi:hypothetical protein
MISDFKFWHFFMNQDQLIHNLRKTEMRQINKRLAVILVLGLLVFALPEIWGMNTGSLTPLLAAGMFDAYTLARWTSLVGTLLWGGLYLSFHLYIVAFLYSRIIGIPWKAMLVMQAYVTALLVLEKGLIFGIFAWNGFSMAFSPFSFGPIAATFLDNTYLVYFFNQLTLFTSLIIAIQYRFIKNFSRVSPKLILLALIIIHIASALFVALFSMIPVDEMIRDFMQGGPIL